MREVRPELPCGAPKSAATDRPFSDGWRVERIGDATLYLGDCRAWLEAAPPCFRVDAVVTDPPYGVSGALNSKTGALKSGRKNDYASTPDGPDYIQAVVAPVIERCIAIARGVVVTPGNRCIGFYPNPAAFGAIYQPASVGLQPWGRADAQPILYYGRSPHGGKGLPSQRCSYQMAGESAQRDSIGHPCPKPIGLMMALVSSASLPGEIVCDPFMGSGTTGMACALLGRAFIGIELDPAYFDIACRRIEEAYRQPRLFDEPAPKPVQGSLLDGEAA